ncbi:hypothetical protein BgAZ_100730 [Babesia gibsoni]|uniref:Uncharacterized protein n=1 Tax=Babesia gibsoni TaxID=33632 RepID=A0AAD8PF66_BABGI|nr:hypothetical protein BgAZ_100730 [Babesia gibsoni]
MLLSTRCLRSNDRGISLQRFLCNRSIDILLRFRALAKRLRTRAKYYNRYTYRSTDSVDASVVESFSKLDKDPIDYEKVAKELVGELISKISFLSNGDCIQVANVLSRIKKPIYRIKHGKDKRLSESGVDSVLEDGKSTSVVKSHATVQQRAQSALTVSKIHEGLANDSTIRLIVKSQRLLFTHLLEAYKNKVLTKAQRYYLYCLLSKECSLVPVDTWMDLKSQLEQDIELTRSYMPFELANILLIYDQICRWIRKRMDVETTANTISGSHIVPIENAVSINTDRSTLHDTFNYAFLDAVLKKLTSVLDQLKSDKIVKLLYLQCSRNLYNKEFFTKAFVKLASQFGCNEGDVDVYRTAIGIYHRATVSNMLKEFKLASSGVDQVIGNLLEGNKFVEKALAVVEDSDSTGRQDGIEALQLKGLNEFIEMSSVSLIGLLCLFIQASKGDKRLRRNIADVTSPLMDNHCADEQLRSALSRCITLDLSSAEGNTVIKQERLISHLCHLLKVTLTNVRFLVTLMRSLQDTEKQLQIRCRSALHLQCYGYIAASYAEILEINHKGIENTSLHEEVKPVLETLRRISTEAEKSDQNVVIELTKEMSEILEAIT